jgi:hypothetical protein
MVAGEAAEGFAIPREDNSHNLRLGRAKQLKELQEQQQRMLQKKLEEQTLEKLEERKKAIRDMSYTMQQLEAERMLKEEKQRKQKVTFSHTFHFILHLLLAPNKISLASESGSVTAAFVGLVVSCRKTCVRSGAARSKSAKCRSTRRPPRSPVPHLSSSHAIRTPALRRSRSFRSDMAARTCTCCCVERECGSAQVVLAAIDCLDLPGVHTSSDCKPA